MSTTQNDTIKTIILLLTLILPVVGAWFSIGFPTDRTSLGYLGAALITAIGVFIQRWQESKSLRKRLKVDKTKS